MGLPEEINPIKFSIGATGGIASKLVITPKPNLPMAAQPDQDNEVIIIEDREDVDRHHRKRSHSPWEDDSKQNRFHKRRVSPSPILRKERSRDQSPLGKSSSSRKSPVFRRSPPKKKSPSNERSREYYRKSISPPHRALSLSRDEPLQRYERSISRSKDYDKEDRSYSREKRSQSRERTKERREYDRKRMDYRESSFERDLKGRERIRTVADLPWEREKRELIMF